MAASAVEESEVTTTLSVSLGLSKEVIAQIASLNEDAATLLRRVKEIFDERSSNDEKYRLDMANLRRARVNAGLSFCCNPFNLPPKKSTFGNNKREMRK